MSSADFSPLSSSSTFTSFKASFPKRRLIVQTPDVVPVKRRSWSFYTQKASAHELDEDQDPVVIITGLYCNIDSCYELILSLSAKGLRLCVLDIPEVDSVEEFVVQFALLMNMLKMEKVHLMGLELGGFLAQCVADKRPDLVVSLLLVNSFASNAHYVEKNIFPEMLVSLTPGIVLRRLLKATLPSAYSPSDDQAADFVKEKLSEVGTKGLVARINLISGRVHSLDESLYMEDERITLVSTLTCGVVPQALREQLHERYPNAKFAEIKQGGDFPQLSNPEEVLLHIQVHLRRIAALQEEDNVHPAKNSAQDTHLEAVPESDPAPGDLVNEEESPKPQDTPTEDAENVDESGDNTPQDQGDNTPIQEEDNISQDDNTPQGETPEGDQEELRVPDS